MEHVTQPSHDSCVIACLAMITGRPVESFSEQHRQLWEEKVPVHHLLADLGVDYRCKYSFQNTLYHGLVYLVTVASLNIPGFLHQIVVDCRDGIRVLDPGQGLPEKHYYQWHEEEVCDPWAVPLQSWMIDYEVIPHD